MTSDTEDGVSPEPDIIDHDLETGDDSMIDIKDPAVRKTESNASSERNTPNGKSSNKDPSRPRRKKARRACFACQRAHLTCGDERPCQRCVKRGISDQCQDGVRKKAKYLHDAPNEALIPPNMGGTYNLSKTQVPSSSQTSGSMMPTSVGLSMYYPEPTPLNVDVYGQNPGSQMQQSLPQHAASSSFGPHTPISPPFSNPTAQQNAGIPGQQTSIAVNQNIQSYPFDPSDPALFNFDISNLNFGNQYGALEFGMLGHMASGANEVRGPPDMITPSSQVPQQSLYSGNIPDHPSFAFGQDEMMNVNWSSQRPPPPPSNAPLETPHNTPIIQSADKAEASNGPYAYAIGARPNSLASASPVSLSQDTPGESTSSPSLFTSGQSKSPVFPKSSAIQHHPVQHPQKSVADSLNHSQTSTLNPSRKRASDGDYVYDTIKEPYGYTAGFHRLSHYISTHYSKDKITRIAHALGRIRPTLLSFAQSLTQKDLIFMEMGVQRKLVSYDEFIKAYGTPTIIVRRDGAIVAVSQEFAILTGWSKEVLLGKKPNLNVNVGVGGSSTGTSTNASNSERGGTRRPSAEPEITNGSANSTSQSGGLGGMQHSKANGTISTQYSSVLLAEIMSQESVAEFYEDYARLAFADPMGIATRRGKLLKYRTREDMDGLEQTATTGSTVKNDKKDHANGKSDSKIKTEDGTANSNIAGEGAFVRLGEKEGVVDCMYCWNVRRDNFEVPQLIVMNFLPVIDPTAA